MYNNLCLRGMEDFVGQREKKKKKDWLLDYDIISEIWESDHIKTCWQTFPPALHSFNTHHLLCSCCPFIGTRMRCKLISHKPPNKRLTKLCKRISSEGLWETFSARPALLWHAQLEYQCSLLPLMFPQSIFVCLFGTSSQGGQISS